MSELGHKDIINSLVKERDALYIKLARITKQRNENDIAVGKLHTINGRMIEELVVAHQKIEVAEAKIKEYEENGVEKLLAKYQYAFIEVKVHEYGHFDIEDCQEQLTLEGLTILTETLKSMHESVVDSDEYSEWESKQQ